MTSAESCGHPGAHRQPIKAANAAVSCWTQVQRTKGEGGASAGDAMNVRSSWTNRVHCCLKRACGIDLARMRFLWKADIRVETHTPRHSFKRLIFTLTVMVPRPSMSQST